MNKDQQLLLNILDEITKKYNAVFEENKDLISQMSFKAHHDILTGIYNRNFFEQQVEIFLQGGVDICFAFIDLDNFKYVNDNYGHEAGDKILIDFTKILKNFFKGADLIARYGGDEFMVAMIECEKTCVKEVLEKLIKKANEKFKKYNIGVSIGVSFFPEESKKFSELIKIADKRMYKIKQSGKNAVCIDDE